MYLCYLFYGTKIAVLQCKRVRIVVPKQKIQQQKL